MKAAVHGTNRRGYATLASLREEGVREFRESLRTLRDGIGSFQDVHDAEERGVRESEQGLDLTVIQMKAETCRDIEGALRRMQAGTFGRCASCGTTIPAARLQAVPFAIRCRDCQAEAEETGSGLLPAA